MTLGCGGTILTYALINVKPEWGGGGADVGDLTFQTNFWPKSPPWGPKNESN